MKEWIFHWGWMAAFGLKNLLDFKASSVSDIWKKIQCLPTRYILCWRHQGIKKRESYHTETSLFNEAEYNNTYLD